MPNSNSSLSNNCDNITTQTITGIKTFNNASNVYSGDGSNLSGVIKTLPANLMKTDITQTITGINTFSNASNVYYGSGANLTGISTNATSITISNMPTSGIFYPLFTNSASAAASLAPSSINQI